MIVHARKAFLKGLSAKENRHIPPLNYQRVIRVKQHFKHLTWEINGGIKTVESVIAFLSDFDGVMLGRVAYENPLMLLRLQEALTGKPVKSMEALLLDYLEYARVQVVELGVNSYYVLKPFLSVYIQTYGEKNWHSFCNRFQKGQPSHFCEALLEAMSYPLKLSE